jgi:hypothetical protein
MLACRAQMYLHSLNPNRNSNSVANPPEKEIQVRSIRILLLVAFAVLLAIAFVDSGIAAASGETVICKAKEEPCSPEKRELGPITIEAKLKKETLAEFTTSLGTMKCNESVIKGTTFEEKEEKPLEGEMSGLTFSSCVMGETACTVEAKNLSYAMSIEPSGEGNGSLTLSKLEVGIPKIFSICGALKCSYSRTSVPLSVVGGNPAKIDAKAVSYEMSEGAFCPKTATFSAEYELQNPAGNRFVETGRTVLCEEKAASCPGTKTNPANTVIESTLENGTKSAFKYVGGNVVECSAATLDGKNTVEKSQPLPITILVFSFGTCSEGANPCTVTVSSVGAGRLRASGLGIGELTILNPVVVIACTSPAYTCEYTKPRVVVDFTGGGAGLDPSPRIKAITEPLSKSAGTCAANLEWTAAYVVSAPFPVYVAG